MKFFTGNRFIIQMCLTAVLFAGNSFAQTRIKQDTLKIKTKDVEVSMEVAAQKGSTFYIVNANRNLDIKTWGENKVKLVSTLSVDENAKVGTGAEMFEEAGITLRSGSKRIELNAKGNAITTAYGGNILSTGQVYYTEHTLLPTKIGSATTILSGFQPKRKTLTLFIPEGLKLDIDSRYSDVVLRDDYEEAKFDLTSANLDAQNINDLSLNAKYSVVNVGDLKDAQLEFENGTFRAININNLDIDSKSSTIEYERGDVIYMRSQRDNYNIDEIKKIEGRKQFGELRIDKLYTVLDIEGNNADVKIRNIDEAVEKVKLNNKYVDVRLPLRNLQNYSVAFEGTYSTVFAPFEKTVIKDDSKDENIEFVDGKIVKDPLEEVTVEGKRSRSPKSSGGSKIDEGSKVVLSNAEVLTYNLTTAGTRSRYYQTGGEISPSKFTASVGNADGKKTKFELVCHSCTIDFK